MPETNDTPRHALVTGAGKRVGAAIARALADGGWAVTVHYNTSAEGAEAVARSIREGGGTAGTYQADLSDPDAGTAMLAAIDAGGPPVSLLVNSAAIFEYDDVETTMAESLSRHFQVNAATPILLAQAFGAAKRNAGGSGVVVNVLDNKIFAPNADYFSYSVAKFALAGATRMLAMALAPSVRVCGIAPAVLLVSGEQTQENYERTRAINPAGRPVKIDDVCRAVLFLAETESVNGEIIKVDGGQALLNLPRDVAFLDEDIIQGFQWNKS
jgi:NAD(P)-dependent dehydrogenase (short-subunit alcohol dehydrogenase family)